MVLRRQVRPQQLDRSEAHRPIRKPIQDQREAARGAGGLDAVIGLPLGEAQHVATVDEERRISFSQVDVAGLQLGEMGDDLGGHAALASDKRLELAEELGIGEARKGNENTVLHVSL